MPSETSSQISNATNGIEPPRGHGIAKEEVLRILIVDKVAQHIVRRESAPFRHGIGIVRAVLKDRDALLAQEVLLPLLRVRAHVNRDLIAERRAQNADTQPQIARGADMQMILREERAEGTRCKNAVVVALLDKSARKGNILGILEHLVAAAARLDAAGNGQVAVAL